MILTYQLSIIKMQLYAVSSVGNVSRIMTGAFVWSGRRYSNTCVVLIEFVQDVFVEGTACQTFEFILIRGFLLYGNFISI